MDIVEGKMMQFLGMFQQRWGRRQDNDANWIEGSRNQLLGLMQERAGYARDGRTRSRDKALKGA
jgi:uncharacterized protein YjbJ (UPF0337 family)